MDAIQQSLSTLKITDKTKSATIVQKHFRKYICRMK